MDSFLYLDAVACFEIKIEKDAVIVIGYVRHIWPCPYWIWLRLNQGKKGYVLDLSISTKLSTISGFFMQTWSVCLLVTETFCFSFIC